MSEKYYRNNTEARYSMFFGVPVSNPGELPSLLNCADGPSLDLTQRTRVVAAENVIPLKKNSLGMDG
jgi:hypothetical protein